MNATLVTQTFNSAEKPKAAANQIVRHRQNGRGEANNVSGWIAQMLQPYYEAVDKQKDFGGRDPLEAVGQADMLRDFLNGGLGIPQDSLDCLLINMVNTGSLTGVKICREAGANPHAFHEAHGVSAMDRAEGAGRPDMVAAMNTSLRAAAPVPAVA
jgi:hypothetical protein